MKKPKVITLRPNISIKSKEHEDTYYHCDKLVGIFREVKDIPVSEEDKKRGVVKTTEIVKTWIVLQFGCSVERYIYLTEQNLIDEFGKVMAENIISCALDCQCYDTGNPQNIEGQRILGYNK